MSVTDVTTGEFHTVLADEKPVLVDFWAPWCGPCRMVGPIVEELSREREDVRVVKVNIDENQPLAAQLNVMSIPTLVLFKDGSEIQRIMGAQPKPRIAQAIDSALA